MSQLFLCESDIAILRSLLHPEGQEGRRLIASEIQKVSEFLEKISPLPAGADFETVGLNDRVGLKNPEDRKDTYDFTVVLPAAENVDEDLISLAAPICLATLGQKKGALVSWETPRGLREMRIESIKKAIAAAA